MTYEEQERTARLLRAILGRKLTVEERALLTLEKPIPALVDRARDAGLAAFPGDVPMGPTILALPERYERDWYMAANEGWERMNSQRRGMGNRHDRKRAAAASKLHRA